MDNSKPTSLSKDQKRVIASTATGFSFENMDFNFMSFRFDFRNCQFGNYDDSSRDDQPRSPTLECCLGD